MTNQDAIKLWCVYLGNENSPSKRYGNLILEKGIIYSYGFHYPLLWKLDGKIYRNITGYSVTTSKHIGMAGLHSDYDVRLNRGYDTAPITMQELREDLQIERTNLKLRSDDLSARAWKQLRDIKERMEKIDEILTITA